VGLDGRLVLAYLAERAPHDKRLALALCADVACTTAVIRSLGIQSHRTPSVAVPPDGRAIVAYSRSVTPSLTGPLEVARCVDSTCSTWQTSTVDASPTGPAVMTIGADGLPVLVYTTGNQFRAAHCADLACSTATISTIFSTFGYTWQLSMEVPADGRPILTWPDDDGASGSGGAVWFARCGDPACTTATRRALVTSAIGHGTYVTIGPDGLPLLIESHAAGVRLIHCADAECTSFTANQVALGVAEGPFAIGPDDLPLIAYRSSDGLRVSHCEDPACATASHRILAPATGDGSEPIYANVRHGGDGRPLIAYKDTVNDDLMIAHCQDATCDQVEPPLDLRIDDNRVIEGTHVGVDVWLSRSVGVPTTVDYATVDGTAVGGADYIPVSGTLTISAGAMKARILVQTYADCSVEGDETFLLRLSNPTNASLADAEATITVNNTAIAPPTLFMPAELSVPESTGSPATLTLPLRIYPPTMCGPVSVGYATRDGSARAGIDYQATSGTATFPPGITTQLVSLPILGDRVHEPSESLFLDLTNPLGLFPTFSRARIAILDDDTAFDTDSEGHADVLVQRGSGDLSVLASDGSGFAETVWDTPGLAPATHEVFFADVDGDGYADGVARSRTNGDVTVRRSTGSAFVAAAGGAWSTGWSSGFDLAFADLTGDDLADLVARDRTNGDVWVLPSTGSAFTPAALWSYGWTTGYRLLFADVTGDGRADLVAQYVGPTPSQTGDVYVAPSTGSAFVFSGRWSYGWSAGYELQLADVDGDDRADLVGRYLGTRLPITGEVYVLHSTGAAFFWIGPAQRWSYGWGADYDLVLRDVTGDRRADLAGRLRTTGEIHVAFAIPGSLIYDGPWASGIADTAVIH
jgi:hypothetical protein